MAVSVLVVDDSAFFRQRVSAILNADPRVTVVGMAENGRAAIEKAQQLRPDVITMDYEMPVMNGIAALMEIMRLCPTPVLMFSSLTYEGARITLEALEAGAVDYLPKSYEQMAPGKGRLEQVLIERILAVSRSRPGAARAAAPPSAEPHRTSPPAPARPVPTSAPRPVEPPRRTSSAKVPNLRDRVSLVVIGTSTGGPVAIQKVLTQLPANFPLPILMVQHMPKAFTGAFAERLNQQCQIQVREAVDGDRLQPFAVYGWYRAVRRPVGGAFLFELLPDQRRRPFCRGAPLAGSRGRGQAPPLHWWSTASDPGPQALKPLSPS